MDQQPNFKNTYERDTFIWTVEIESHSIRYLFIAVRHFRHVGSPVSIYTADLDPLLHPNFKIHRLHEPEILRVPVRPQERKVEITQESRNQLGHLQDGDVLPQTSSGTESKLINQQVLAKATHKERGDTVAPTGIYI